MEVATLLESAQNQRQALLDRFSGPLTQITTAAVRELIHRELSVSPSGIEQMVTRLLDAVSDCSKVQVRVHPSEYLAAVEAHPVWQSSRFGDWEVVVIPDESISVGGCELRYATGRIDERMETKLELLEASIRTFMERSVKADVANSGA